VAMIKGKEFKAQMCAEDMGVVSCSICPYNGGCKTIDQVSELRNKYTKRYNEPVPTEDIPIVSTSKDYSKKKNQIGCGYCIHEFRCTKRDPKINKAKLGCKKFKHYSKK
jgi:hypothetical protein